MHKIFAAAIIGMLAFAPMKARAETLTAEVGGRTITYIITSGQRGPELTREEILDSLRNAKPATVVSAPQPTGPDAPKDRATEPDAPKER